MFGEKYNTKRCLMQARVIHNSSFEWQQIKDGAEKAKTKATTDGDEIGEMTCSELLEALELSRCLLLMKYCHLTQLHRSCKHYKDQDCGEMHIYLARVALV